VQNCILRTQTNSIDKVLQQEQFDAIDRKHFTFRMFANSWHAQTTTADCFTMCHDCLRGSTQYPSNVLPLSLNRSTTFG